MIGQGTTIRAGERIGAAVRASALGVAIASMSACAGAGADREMARAAPTIEGWREGLAKLGEIRAAAASPRTQRIALRLREPVTGRTLEARGAVAIAPPDALRMILLGPGGTTAVDLWIARDRYRFAVPAIDLLKRGDASTPRSARRGLPVDFLRWWLLRPAHGSLLWTARDGDARRLVLRDGDAIVDLLVSAGGRIQARRASWSPDGEASPRRLVDEETAVADRAGCAPVRYHQSSTGLDVTVTCEGEDVSPPNPRAFVDPDAEASP